MELRRREDILRYRKPSSMEITIPSKLIESTYLRKLSLEKVKLSIGEDIETIKVKFDAKRIYTDGNIPSR